MVQTVRTYSAETRRAECAYVSVCVHVHMCVCVRGETEGIMVWLDIKAINGQITKL